MMSDNDYRSYKEYFNHIKTLREFYLKNHPIKIFKTEYTIYRPTPKFPIWQEINEAYWDSMNTIIY